MQLNADKTQYKIFSKARKSIQEFNIYLSEYILNDRKVDECSSPAGHVKIKLTSKPVKYLGIWLDTHLNFNYFEDEIIQHCNKIYYTIQGNLCSLWGIKANVGYQILDACILSIIDYSSIVFPLMGAGAREDLRKYYNKIIRASYRPVRDTQLDAVFQQLNILDFENRWKKITSKYFSHIIRIPQITLRQEVRREYYYPVKIPVIVIH